MSCQRSHPPARPHFLWGRTFLFAALLLAAGMWALQPQSRAADPAAPDLVAEITVQPANPGANEQVTVSFVVHNVGDAGTGRSFTAYLYVDPPDQPPTPATLGRPFGFPPLAAGHSSAAASRTYRFADIGCQHRIYVWVDRDNDVVERREDNNLTTYQLCVGVACEVDAYEGTQPPWDNVSAAASWLYAGDAQSHTFCQAQNKQLPDDDWIKFTAFAGITYTLEATAYGAHADPAVILCTGDCQPPLGGPARRLDWLAPGSGVFYARVVNGHIGGTNPGPLTAYTLTLDAHSSVNDGYEPDNTCAEAHELLAGGPAQPHRFQHPADHDWVHFQLAAGQSFTLRAENPGPNVQPQIALFASCQAAHDPNAALATGDGQIMSSAASSQSYYARLSNRDSTIFGENATYDLRLLVSDCSGDAHEDDDTPAQATHINVGSHTPLLTSCPAGDEDWLQFSAEEGRRYLLQTSDLAPAADTVLTLFGPDGATVLASNDDYGYGKASRLLWLAKQSGAYYVQVRHYDSQAAGDDTAYRLSLQQGACQPDAWDDGAASDNGPEDATSISLPGLDQTHNFCAQPGGLALADQDWLRWQATAGSTITLSAQALGSQADPVLEIVDAQGQTLAANDDAGPGSTAMLVYTATATMPLFLRVRPFNTHVLGNATDYRLRAQAFIPPTPTPTPTPAPTPSPSPTPLPSTVQTLILINRSRFADLYGAAATQQLMSKLQQLADHERVQGAVIVLEQDPAVAAAYAAWLADTANNDQANAVAAAIRSRILSFFAAGPAIRHVVLVGDDRIIPFRRVGEGTVNKKESSYVTHVSGGSEIAAAIGADQILTDDYYVDREPGAFQGAPLYLPDYGIGRLIEQPADITGQIDQFLAEPVIHGQRALVTGYDFVQDSAAIVATMIQADNISTERLITGPSTTWGGSHLRAFHLNAPQRYDIQAINGHSTHVSTGTPDLHDLQATEILTATGDLTGAIIYAVGCHSGLNDPGLVDLPEAFARRHVTYIGNTGYGWGGSGIVYSEALMRNFTRELLRDNSAQVGPALAAAKRRYRNSTFSFGPYDAKILMQATLYGLPMVELQTGGALTEDDAFPSADSSFSPPGFGGELNEGTFTFNLAGAFGENDSPGQGSFADLDGHVIFSAGAPLQPMYFGDVSAPQAGTLRGILFRGGNYQEITAYDPVIARPHNEYITDLAEPAFGESGWWPPVPFALQNSETVSQPADSLILSLGQYHGEDATLRLYGQLSLSALYSDSPDTTPPLISHVDGVYDPQNAKARIKVQTSDASGIAHVVIALDSGDGQWRSTELPYVPALGKASGEITATIASIYFVQVADNAGNVTVANNKGRYYTILPPQAFAPGRWAAHTLYLPYTMHTR